MDRSAILEAVRHKANHKPIIFCSLSLVAVGILLAVFGIVVLIVDHAELGPPVYDTQYERYQGSSLAHILGPMFIGFGSLIVVGNICMLIFATANYYQSSGGGTSRSTTPKAPSDERQTSSKQKIAASTNNNNSRRLMMMV